MSDVIRNQIDAMLKASELVIKLVQEDLRPVCTKCFDNGDGTGTFVYAHANGEFNLICGEDGGLSVNGTSLDNHLKINQAAALVLSKAYSEKDVLMKGSPEDILQRHSSVLRLKKVFEDSRGAIDVISEHLRKGRTPHFNPEDEWWQLDKLLRKKRTSRVNPFGRAKFFTDRNPDNDPNSGA